MGIKRIFNFILKFWPDNRRVERIWKLAQVDFKRRYYNDKLGLLWALINPIIRVVIYYIVFTFLFERKQGTIDNFALFLFSALIFWMLFTEVIKRSFRILKEKKYLIENVGANMLDVFYSLGLSSLFGIGFNLLAYFFIALLMGTSFSQYVLILPVLIINIFLIGIGFGMCLSVLTVIVNDIIHLVDILILLGFWGSGIFFPSDKILQFWSPWYYINPFVGIFENLRHLLVFNTEPNYQIMTINIIQGLICYFIGQYVLRRFGYLAMENR